MRVRYRYFRGGAFTTWDEMFDRVGQFATRIGKDRLIGIAQSEDNSEAIVTVWYWSAEEEAKGVRNALPGKPKK